MGEALRTDLYQLTMMQAYAKDETLSFLIFLFFHWLFIEAKNYGLRGERFFHKH